MDVEVVLQPGRVGTRGPARLHPRAQSLEDGAGGGGGAWGGGGAGGGRGRAGGARGGGGRGAGTPARGERGGSGGRGGGAMAATRGLLRWRAPVEPKNFASPKAKIPPSEATSQ